MSTATTCPYCGVGCGVAASASAIAGDETHPANFGKLCSKGTALGETLTPAGRLLYPMIGDQRATWSRATHLIAKRFKDTIAKHGPDSVAFYVSGQLLTEDYYVANKLMKGFIGSANIDTNSRLCMASAVAAHKLSFGEDVVPGCYDDLELADLVVFAGHNAAWTHPVLYRRMEPAMARGQRHIVIDPRETDTARSAFLHLKLKSQTDVRLWNGLLAFLIERSAIDRAYVAAHTTGFVEAFRALSRDDQTIDAIARDCGILEDDVETFFATFASTPKTVTLFSQGVNQSAQGVAKCLAIINAHLATGRVSKPGASPFSITGQPNAMGGRETGGMATTMAAHLNFTTSDIDSAQRFWNAPRIAQQPGLKAVDMFDAVHDGRIKALWIMATNPAVSMPDAERVRAALAACPFVVVSDVLERTDTSRFAHVRLPAQAWGEKDGTVTNSERRISRQRAFLAVPGSARADWRIVADVARAMGHEDAFAFDTAAAVFREYAAMTAFENDGARVLDLGPLAQLSDDAYDALAPTQWPITNGNAAHPFASGVFPTPTGKAMFQPTPVSAPAQKISAAFPLSLNTGRVRDQWHTMTRTGLSPRLMRHAPEPVVSVHPIDAALHNVRDGDLALLRSPHGEAVMLARITNDVRPGELFAPMHWTDVFAPRGRANALVNPAVDARSGQPEFKHTPVALAPAPVAWRGFCVSRAPIDLPLGVIWRRAPIYGGCLIELAGTPDAPTPSEFAARLFEEGAHELLHVGDGAGGFLRRALVRDGRLERALFITTRGALPARDWLAKQLAKTELDDETRRALLAGGASAPRGANVCACFDVSKDRIEALARAEPNLTVACVGQRLKAGTNCGSCRPEIARILKELTHEQG